MAPQVEEFPSWRHHVESAIALRKRTLAAALERQLADAHASGPEIRWVLCGAPGPRLSPLPFVHGQRYCPPRIIEAGLVGPLGCVTTPWRARRSRNRLRSSCWGPPQKCVHCSATKGPLNALNTTSYAPPHPNQPTNQPTIACGITAARSATRALGQLLGDCHAVAAMLHCYSRKVGVHQAQLLKQLAAGACA
jgi:hypothetical protein